MKKYFKYFAVLGIYTFLVLGCETKKPALIYNANADSDPVPTISGIEPTDGAFSGFTIVSIIGTDLATAGDTSKVYFNNAEASIISITSSIIEVLTPNIEGDSVTIQVVVSGALLPGRYGPYIVSPVFTEYGPFGNLDQVFSIAVDKDENLYTQMRGKAIIKVTADGDSNTIGTTSFPKASEMRMGPDGYLYIVRSNNERIYRLGPAGGEAEEFVVLAKKVRFMDFDADKNIYAAGTQSGIHRVTAGAEFKEVGNFSQFDVFSLRVYNGYVYIAAEYLGSNTSFPKKGIWRSTISSTDGDLSAPEVVLDWSTTGAFSSADMLAITFGETGDLFIGTTNKNPILVIDQAGGQSILYKNILTPDATHLVWGAGTFLYVNRTNDNEEIQRVIRVNMDQHGAPYYGRD